jgi:hypothetical protein
VSLRDRGPVVPQFAHCAIEGARKHADLVGTDEGNRMVEIIVRQAVGAFEQ